MRAVILTRDSSGDDGTFGTWVSDSGFKCRTGELPDRGNASGISCIPKGSYSCNWRFSPKHGMCWHVDGVPGRTEVEIHAANLMGDTAKGYVSQLLGCIAPGLTVGTFAAGAPPAGKLPQSGVTGSGAALKALQADLAGETRFQLTIR
jgi:hypothetical protein